VGSGIAEWIGVLLLSLPELSDSTVGFGGNLKGWAGEWATLERLAGWRGEVAGECS
jgi:hypothetical protein